MGCRDGWGGFVGVRKRRSVERPVGSVSRAEDDGAEAVCGGHHWESRRQYQGTRGNSFACKRANLNLAFHRFTSRFFVVTASGLHSFKNQGFQQKKPTCCFFSPGCNGYTLFVCGKVQVSYQLILESKRRLLATMLFEQPLVFPSE